jgi:hypothetical protein
VNTQEQVQNCPSCSVLLAERGFFCASCAVQVRCKVCREHLEKGARACVMCGTPIGTGGASSAGNGHSSPMNTLDLQEDTRSRFLRISFTDAAIGSIGETVNHLVLDKLAPRGPRSFKAPGTLPHNVPELPAATAEVAGQVIDVPPAGDQKSVVQPTGDAERIRNIFEADGEDFRLEENRLKADSRNDYARRLTYLFVYAHELVGRKPIRFDLVKKMLETSKVWDNNTRNLLRHKMAVEIEGDTIRLKKEGREKAIHALDEILDPAYPDAGWTPESQGRTTRSGGDAKEAKQTGKVGRKRSNQAEEWAAKWEKHADNVDGHFILKDKTILDKAILALWAIHKVGGKVASPLYMQRFIAAAFSFNEKVRSVRTTLERENAREFLILADGGYKLTPSGTKRAEQMAKAAK